MVALRELGEVLEECGESNVLAGLEVLLEANQVANGLGLGPCMCGFLVALTVLQDCDVVNAVALVKAIMTSTPFAECCQFCCHFGNG